MLKVWLNISAMDEEYLSTWNITYIEVTYG